ncbi:MAG: ribonuclease HII [Deltaproteobacteria bacterium]|nr:ribonuclease HII [Deltaproteobacteria bacterium]
MDSFEKDARSKGFSLIAGVDEAGRGPLAGPVVAAAVIFSSSLPLKLGIRDSKALTAKAREGLVFGIYREALSVGIGIIWPVEIDEINIHQASLKAMEKAVGELTARPEFLLIDGCFPIKTELPQLPVISGDALSVSIAAASIIAKTTRDRIMDGYEALYPGYNFASNKGYGTKEHFAALSKIGPCPIHRRSFRGVLS